MTNDDDRKALLSVRDVAHELGVTPARIYQMVSAQAIPHIRMGKAVRIPARAWRSWLDAQNEEALANVRRG
jgi:excisionase family DNA binding protein